MTAYTSLNIADLNAIADLYGIPKIDSHKILSGGSENTNFFLETKSGKYVLTVCEQKSLQKADELVQLLEYLNSHHFSTSIVLRTLKNEGVILWKEKPLILKEFLEGDIIADLSTHLLEYIGKELGRLHKIDAPDYLPKDISYTMEYFEEVKTYAPNSSFHQWLAEVKKDTEQHLSAELPKALIHSDVFYSNIIVSEDKNSAVIMDFEEACYYYRIFDLGMTIVGLCKEGKTINLTKASQLLKGYYQEISLSAVEKNALQAFTRYAAAAMAFWRHKNFNYTNPTPEMTNHYVELKDIADYINDLPNHCFDID